ncbi:D-alanyl-D-alanine carboxypeptidase [Evansella sp. AB-P1]|uniref:D-alanyl-D-alanine carboxypeptidase family protein n=1 Tax=Evansella sp. AB-P1 TaxID=3037653 RepID=UPI00241F3E24|nr:D-alanyl-D-alanine carboxypeptidase family protein [Evansella sp. AB-P1]MDG5787500.1 D-alanyl-D-alanine carboxypeptidase [Evansella sp. AB-P1]
MNQFRLFFIHTFFISLILLFFPYYYINANDQRQPIIYSESAILMDKNTGEILYEKNGYKQMYPASLTKILTAIVTIETQDLSEVVTVSSEAVHAIGTRVYLLEGEEITLGQLLQGLMVSSGNDAAIAIAEHIDGSVEEFSKRMTSFAHNQIGVSEDSNFSNPHGLFGYDHYTTAVDLAKISAYAMENEVFRELVGTEYVEWIGEGWETIIYNHHPLLRSEERIIGIKNGFVSQSGYTLSTAAENDSTELIAITLKAPSRYEAMADTLALLDYGFDNFETQWISFDNEPLLINYIYPPSFPVTTKLEEDISYTISNEGYVTVKGENNRLIMTIDLEEREVLELPYIFNNFSVEVEEEEVLKKTVYWKDWLIITGFYFFFWIYNG